MTPKFDRIAISFVKKIPTAFKTVFTPGIDMPDANLFTKEIIADYINRAMMKLFNQYWQQTAGNFQAFLAVFPELVKFSGELEGSEGFAGTVYQVAAPYFDFCRIVGAIGPNNQFIKVWDETKFTLAISGQYTEYTATTSNPAIIQIHGMLFVFPQTLNDFNFKIQYIKYPIDPATGGPLVQNGNEDSPFGDQWNDIIAELAYALYLEESFETT
jgi:hypothetical protein